MARIRVDDESLMTASQEFTRLASEMDGIYTELNSLINELDSSWEGNAAEAYIANLRRDLCTVKNTSEIMTELAAYSKNTAESMREKDELFRRLHEWFSEMISAVNQAIQTLGGAVN